MAVSIGELLGEVRTQLDALHGEDADQAMAALAGLAPIGRALDHVYPAHQRFDIEARPPHVTVLAGACHEIARGWPDGTGRVADLLGATADTIGRHADSFSCEQRTALIEALAETARRCADVARRFPPYANVSQLSAVRVAAVACERHATALPGGASDRTVLDHLVPARNATERPAERMVDAVAALRLALGDDRQWRRLDMAEMVITLNAAQLVSAHAATALHELAMSRELPGLAAPTAWRAARAYCASFDDGSKLRPPEGSPIASAAAGLGRAVLDHLGPADNAPTRAAVEPDTVRALQTVMELLPDVARSLDRATWNWIADDRMWAPERRLLSYEDRNDAATSSPGNARAGVDDLAPLSSALGLAAALTAALAGELAETSPTAVRLAHLSQARIPTSDANLSRFAQSARDGERHANALHPSEWAIPTRSREQRSDPVRRARTAVDRAAIRQSRTEAHPRQRHDDQHLDHASELGR